MTIFYIDKPVTSFIDAVKSNKNALEIFNLKPEFFKADEWYMFPHDLEEIREDLLKRGGEEHIKEEETMLRGQMICDELSHLSFIHPPVFGVIARKADLLFSFTHAQSHA